MKIEVQPYTFLYNGPKDPAWACVFADRTFVNGDGQSVVGGNNPSRMSGYVKRVAVTGAAGVWTAGAFDDADELDSTIDTVSSQVLATYTLVIFSQTGTLLAVLGSGIKLPETPTITEWDDAIAYSQAASQPYRAAYYDVNAINRLLADVQAVWGNIQGDLTDQTDLVAALTAVAPLWGAITGDITDQTDLNTILDSLQTQISGIPAAADASTSVKGISRISTAPASPTVPIAAGINDPRVISTIGSIDIGGTGTISPTAASFEYAVVRLTGILTGNRLVNWAGNSTDRRSIIIDNQTTGDFTVHIKATAEGGGGTILTRDAPTVLINDGTAVQDMFAVLSRPPFYVLEFDGTPQSIDFGVFNPMDVPLGDCFYETWTKRGVGNGATDYDWSEGYGPFHSMLRNVHGGNVVRAASIVGATNATPIEITTAQPHGFTTGDVLQLIKDVTGNTAANGASPTITVTGANTFTINGSVGNGLYTGGGVARNTFVSFSADDVPYVGQWAHSGTGVSDDTIVQYYDGVPVGKVEFIGERMCYTPETGSGHGFLGGSDHNNYKGRISQYRVFEGANPHNAGLANVHLSAFRPETVFGGFVAAGSSEYESNLLVDLFKPDQIIVDKSMGYPRGVTHPGKIRGTGDVTSPFSTYPGPQFVVDNDAPQALGLVAVEQPAGKTYTLGTPPVGSLIFDSFERKNSTYAFDGYAGLGSTEAGSLGALAWTELGAPVIRSFGILNEKAVVLTQSGVQFARVNAGQANVDIRVDRFHTATFGSGRSTGILFRYVDDNNYCYLRTSGTTYINQVITIGQVVAGVVTEWADTGSACPTNTWQTLRLLTKSDGTYSVYCNTDLVADGTEAANAAGTGCGITTGQSAAHTQGVGLELRWKNFTVLNNP